MRAAIILSALLLMPATARATDDAGAKEIAAKLLEFRQANATFQRTGERPLGHPMTAPVWTFSGKPMPERSGPRREVEAARY